MTSREDLNRIHYVIADDTALFEELKKDGALFNPDTTGKIYHVSRASGPANLAVMTTIRQGSSAETVTSLTPAEDTKSL